MAGVTKRPEQVCGMHFMNPVPVMKLVEGIRGLQTSDDTFNKIRKFTESLGKVFIEANDHPGFVVNRILLPMINEAIFTLSDGIASAEDIDQAMKLGTNQPMGPLALADLIGLDTCLAIMNVLHEELGESKYRPCPLLVKHVEAGWLGRKTNRGFQGGHGGPPLLGSRDPVTPGARSRDRGSRCDPLLARESAPPEGPRTVGSPRSAPRATIPHESPPGLPGRSLPTELPRSCR